MKKKSVIEFLIVAIISTGGLLYLNNWGEEFTKSLLKSGDFAKGTFIKFTVNLVGYSHDYHYYYYNKEGVKISETGARNMPDRRRRNEIKKGDVFFVIYNKDGSLIFFDKPIKDSTDFKRYVKEIEEMRKRENNK